MAKCKLLWNIIPSQKIHRCQVCVLNQDLHFYRHGGETLHKNIHIGRPRVNRSCSGLPITNERNLRRWTGWHRVRYTSQKSGRHFFVSTRYPSTTGKFENLINFLWERSFLTELSTLSGNPNQSNLNQISSNAGGVLFYWLKLLKWLITVIRARDPLLCERDY